MEIYLMIIILMSLTTLILYRNDKLKAKKNKWRTPEKILLLSSFLGGAIGGIFAMYTLRHKNKHWYFVVINFASLILHITLGYYLYKTIGFMYL